MKRKIFLLVIICVLQACSSTKNANDKWIGQSKRDLIKIWGPPIRILNDADKGEILIYGEQVYLNAKNEEGSRIAGPNYWNYTYVYVNKEGKISSYKLDKQQRTPQEVALN